jgi:hypothetical protein
MERDRQGGSQLGASRGHPPVPRCNHPAAALLEIQDDASAEGLGTGNHDVLQARYSPDESLEDNAPVPRELSTGFVVDNAHRITPMTLAFGLSWCRPCTPASTQCTAPPATIIGT